MFLDFFMVISERFLKFFVGNRISERFLDFLWDQNFWMFLGLQHGDQNFLVFFLDFFMGIRISERFWKFFMGTRISECFLEFFVGIRISLFPLGFLGGIINYESYNKKVPKEHCSESSLLDGIRKKKPCLNLPNFTDFPFYSLQIAYILRNSKMVQYVMAILLRICPNRNATF